MEAERRKRKIEEENEEAKIEEFFALIRSTREIRDRLRRNSNQDNKKKTSDHNYHNKAINGSVWNPTFRIEDFLEDHKTTPVVIRIGQEGPSNQKEGKEEGIYHKEQDKGDNGLDLNLSL